MDDDGLGTCEQCGTSKVRHRLPSGRTEARVAARARRFCSPECANLARRVGPRHGTQRMSRTGCECAECERAREAAKAKATERLARIKESPDFKAKRRAERERRWRADPREVPHGTASGYSNYRCRCDLCSHAYAGADRAARARFKDRPRDPESIPHGTVNGYSKYGCRCDECKAANVARNNKRRSRDNAALLETAVNWRKEWTGPELEIALREDLSARQAARMLGRSLAGVEWARHKARSDPKFIDLAGMPSEVADD